MMHILEVDGESNFLAIEAGPLRTAFNIDRSETREVPTAVVI